jgi:predicted metal-binding membrane protein
MTMHVAMALRAAPFFASWVIIMVAMMSPTAAPMILSFHSAQGKRHPDDAFVSTWAFVIAYFLVWAVSGIAAYTGVLAAGSRCAPEIKEAANRGRPLNGQATRGMGGWELVL